MTASKGGPRRAATAITRVDCRSPHEEEVTGTFNLSGSRYPGDNAVDKAGDARCKKYFTRYVGIDWDSSAYNYDYATPDRPTAGGMGTAWSSASPMT